MPEERLPRPRNRVWSTYLDEWDRATRAVPHPYTTRYNYQLAATQLADYLAEHSPDPDAIDAADDPTDTTKGHVESFIAWMIDTRSASTARNKFKGLQQFFGYLANEDEMAASPLARIPQPKVPKRLVPVVPDDAVSALLATCSGKSFVDRRDTALIRALFDSGGRLAEITNLTLDDLDLKVDLFRVIGKGDRQRAIPFGPKTGQALTRYLRVRAKHRGADLDQLWLAERVGKPLGHSGVKIMLRRRGKQAQLDGSMHAHRFRHTLAHEWLVQGGNETDLMRLMGWESRDMLLHYGASAGQQRAQQAHRSMKLGDRV
ncbi:tyrosine-type recombinase/integrase [Prauserella cavernicola]|uniref:Tyrosine-type recombinase/integrase n=1 Tax=Prauserella cavernicola TaxID=2800127 RepID=A0A934R0C7_9PSEU|nr:tyrosine-type recombinase/integrase [Prauserella cavernicola]MBK1788794.1 tyrosine-type recombinase/integrase [Prauserella cavernicola]